MSKKLKPVGTVQEDKNTTTAVSTEASDDALKAVEQQLMLEDGFPDQSKEIEKKKDKRDKDDKAKDDGNTKKPEENPALVTDGPVADMSVASKPAAEMNEDELKLAQEALKKRETTIGTKTLQTGDITYQDKDGKRLDAVSSGKTKEVAEFGGKITGVSGDVVKYEGDLGTFEYNTKDWALATKTVKDDFSGVTTTIPVLRYINEDNSWKPGDQVYGGNIEIPEGLKSLDYSFENNKDLATIPRIPDSVESAHAAFKNCKNVARAARNAKEDEHNGGVDIAGWAAGGGAAGFGIGSFFGGVGAVPGYAIGAVAGVVAGGAKGIHDACTSDGKGGTWDMPDNLKDASEMFSGCENLTEAYDAAGKNLINARGMYAGTKNLGTDEVANKFGSVAITDFNSDSKLSKESVQGSYSGTNVELTDELKGNYSKDWNEDTGTLNKKDISQDEKQEVEQLNQTLKEHDAVFGEENTDMTAQTDGLASHGTVKTEHGSQSTTDIHAENAESAGLEGSNLLDRGLVSLGEFWILKKVTGNMLVAGAATFGLQAVGILPKSMKPVLNAVTGFVGKDSAIGKALSGIVSKLPDEKKDDSSVSDKLSNSVESLQDKKEKDASDKTNSTVDERVKADMNTVSTIASKNASGTVDISRQMASNGVAVAKDGVLLTAGNKSTNDQEFESVRGMSMTMAAGLESKATSMAGESGKLSKEDKKALAMQCMNIMNGMNAYHDGAMSQIHAQYGTNNQKAVQAENGLSKVMYASTTPFVDAVKDMDAQYGFLSKEDKVKLSSMEMAGVPKYDTYVVGDMEKQSADAFVQSQKTESSVSDDLPEDDMSMYANAGLDDDIQDSSKKTLAYASMPSPHVLSKTKGLQVETRVSKASAKTAKPSVDRGTQAEQRFGSLVKDVGDVEKDDYNFE